MPVQSTSFLSESTFLAIPTLVAATDDPRHRPCSSMWKIPPRLLDSSGLSVSCCGHFSWWTTGCKISIFSFLPSLLFKYFSPLCFLNIIKKRLNRSLCFGDELFTVRLFPGRIQVHFDLPLNLTKCNVVTSYSFCKFTSRVPIFWNFWKWHFNTCNGL